MKKSWHLSRREALRGIGGISLGLPFLESMAATSKANSNHVGPKRLACMFFPNGVTLPSEKDPHHTDWNWFPKGEGKNFKLNKSTESFEPHRQDITFLSGLSHPAGRHMAGHGVSDVFLTAGPVDANSYQNTISFDQLVAKKHGRETRLPFLPLSVGGGVGTLGRTHTLSYTKTGQPIPAESNIRRCFNMMFGQEKDSLDKARRELLVRKSMLDGVLEDSRSLKTRLNATDRSTLDNYLDSVRQQEQRIQRLEGWLEKPKAEVDEASLSIDATSANMQDYVRAFYDLMFHAFRTDTTRVITHMLGIEGGGSKSDHFPRALGLDAHHALSHRRKSTFKDWGIWDQFMNENFAYLLKQLKEAPEGEGSILDNTLIMYGCSTSTTHLARNYPLILAGGKNMGLEHGHFRMFDENKVRLSDMYVTLLNTLGVETKQFGDSTRELNEILQS